MAILTFNDLSGGLVDSVSKLNAGEVAVFKNLNNFYISEDRSLIRRPPVEDFNIYGSQQRQVGGLIKDVKKVGNRLFIWRDVDVSEDTVDFEFSEQSLSPTAVMAWLSAADLRVDMNGNFSHARMLDGESRTKPVFIRKSDGTITEQLGHNFVFNRAIWKTTDVDASLVPELRRYEYMQGWPESSMISTTQTVWPFIMRPQSYCRVLDVYDVDRKIFVTKLYFIECHHRVLTHKLEGQPALVEDQLKPANGGRAYIILRKRESDFYLESYTVVPETTFSEKLEHLSNSSLSSPEDVIWPKISKLDIQDENYHSVSRDLDRPHLYSPLSWVMGHEAQNSYRAVFDLADQNEIFSKELTVFNRGIALAFAGHLYHYKDDNNLTLHLNGKSSRISDFESRQHAAKDELFANLSSKDLPIRAIRVYGSAGPAIKFPDNRTLVESDFLIPDRTSDGQNNTEGIFRIKEGTGQLGESIDEMTRIMMNPEDYNNRSAAEKLKYFPDSKVEVIDDFSDRTNELSRAVNSLRGAITAVPENYNILGSRFYISSKFYVNLNNVRAPKSGSLNNMFSLFLDVKAESNVGGHSKIFEYVGNTDYVAFDSLPGMPQLPAENNDDTFSGVKFLNPQNIYMNPQSEIVLNEQIMRNTVFPVGGGMPLGGLGVFLVKFADTDDGNSKLFVDRHLFGQKVEIDPTNKRSTDKTVDNKLNYNEDGWNEVIRRIKEIVYVYVDWTHPSFRDIFDSLKLVELPASDGSLGYGSLLLSKMPDPVETSETGDPSTPQEAIAEYIKRFYASVHHDHKRQKRYMHDTYVNADEPLSEHFYLPFPLGMWLDKMPNRYEVLSQDVNQYYTDLRRLNYKNEPFRITTHQQYRHELNVRTGPGMPVNQQDMSDQSAKKWTSPGFLTPAVHSPKLAGKVPYKLSLGDTDRLLTDAEKAKAWGASYKGAILYSYRGGFWSGFPKEILPTTRLPYFLGSIQNRAVLNGGDRIYISELLTDPNDRIRFSAPMRDFFLNTQLFTTSLDFFIGTHLNRREYPYGVGENNTLGERIPDSPVWNSAEIFLKRDSTIALVHSLATAFLDETDSIFIALEDRIMRVANLLSTERPLGRGVLSNVGAANGLLEFDGRAFLAISQNKINLIRYTNEARSYVATTGNPNYRNAPRLKQIVDLYANHRLVLGSTEEPNTILAISMGERRNVQGMSLLRLASSVKQIFRYDSDCVMIVFEDGTMGCMNFNKESLIGDEKQNWDDYNIEEAEDRNFLRPNFELTPIQFVVKDEPTFDGPLSLHRAFLGFSGFLVGRLFGGEQNALRQMRAMNEDRQGAVAVHSTRIRNVKHFSYPVRAEFPVFSYQHTGEGFIKIESFGIGVNK